MTEEQPFKFTLFHGLLLCFTVMLFTTWLTVDDPVITRAAGGFLVLILFPFLAILTFVGAALIYGIIWARFGGRQ